MAGNPLPGTVGELLALGGRILAGLQALGAELGITQVTPEMFAAALGEYTATQTAFAVGRGTRLVASRASMAEMAAVTRWLGMTRNVLAARLGNRWSPLWAQAGFTTARTSIPRRGGELLSLMQRLAFFFTENPEWEVPALEVTAARATVLRAAAQAAGLGLREEKVALDGEGLAREAARAEFTRLVRTVMAILRVTLSREDARWVTFGLQKPGARTTPGQPQGVRAGLTGTGKISASCEPERLATRYRWRMRVVGGSRAFALVARTREPFAIFPVPPEGTVEIIVQAVNGEAQGVASEPVFFTLAERQERRGQLQNLDILKR